MKDLPYVSLQRIATKFRVDSVGGDLHMSIRDPRDDLPDIRDGLTHRERIVLQCLYGLQQERGGRNVPTGMLYGTVGEYVDMSAEERQSIVVRLIGHPLRSRQCIILYQ